MARFFSMQEIDMVILFVGKIGIVTEYY